jgi:hypothetical protein
VAKKDDLVRTASSLPPRKPEAAPVIHPAPEPRAAAAGGGWTRGQVLAMQRSIGNRAVQRLLSARVPSREVQRGTLEGGVMYDVRFNPSHSSGKSASGGLTVDGTGGDRPPDRPVGKNPNEGHYHSPFTEVDQESIDEFYANLDRLEKSLESATGKRGSEAPQKGERGERRQDDYGRGRFADLLAERYPGANPTVLRHLAQTKRILTDRGYAEGVLLRLQQEMERRNVSVDVVLSEAEERQGFRPRLEVSDLLSREAFLGNLANAHHIFDAGTPAEHGPHSHRLQWYILYAAHADGRLRMPPVYLYGLLSLPAFNDPRSPLRAAWDDLFDFDDEAVRLMELPTGNSREENRAAAAFSSPEYLQGRLVSGQSSLGTGALVRELRNLAHRYEHLRAQGVLDLHAGLVAQIITRTVMSNLSMSTRAVSYLELELLFLSVEELEDRYVQLNPAYKRQAPRK